MSLNTITVRYEADPATRLPVVKVPEELQRRLPERDRKAAAAVIEKEYQAIAVGRVPATLELPWGRLGLPTT